jgi:hypothetical protein
MTDKPRVAPPQPDDGMMLVPVSWAVAVNEFIDDWRKGDFQLPPLAACDVNAIIEAGKSAPHAATGVSPEPTPDGARGTAEYYAREDVIQEVAVKITSRVAENAVRMAIGRNELTQDDGAAIDDKTEQDIVQDTLQGVLGEDTGCLDEDDLNETNCELLFVGAELRKLLAAAPPEPTPAREFARDLLKWAKEMPDNETSVTHLASVLNSRTPATAEVLEGLKRDVLAEIWAWALEVAGDTLDSETLQLNKRISERFDAAKERR